MKPGPESYVVVLTYDAAGKKRAKRHPVVVPVAVCTGDFQELSDLALREHIKDLVHEQIRRSTGEQCPEIPQWDPFATQIRQELNLDD